jgi:hypothetical protein
MNMFKKLGSDAKTIDEPILGINCGFYYVHIFQDIGSYLNFWYRLFYIKLIFFMILYSITKQINFCQVQSRNLKSPVPSQH